MKACKMVVDLWKESNNIIRCDGLRLGGGRTHRGELDRGRRELDAQLVQRKICSRVLRTVGECAHNP